MTLGRSPISFKGVENCFVIFPSKLSRRNQPALYISKNVLHMIYIMKII